MDNLQILAKVNPPTWLKILVIILIGLGIFFRFAHLGHKIYCCDESWTSVAISGHTVAGLKQEVFNYQGTIPITIFDKYQHINPGHGVADTVNYLITSDPQHPPLYYVMVRLWAQVFGDSPTGMRSLSALISMLIFPSVYWLCLELFESTVVGWVAMALVAVSPLQLFFAQEARQYSLWMVEILLSSAALLRTIRQENKVNWVVYTLTLPLGLYTHLFTVLVMISHGIYVVIQQQFRFTKTLLNYLLVSIAAFLIFLPWLIAIIPHTRTALELTSGSAVKWINNPFELIAIFLIRVTRIFFDLNLTSDIFTFNSFTLEGSLIYSITALIFSLSLIGYLIFYIIKILKYKTSLLIFLMGGFTSLLLVIYDLISGGIRSIQVRYQLPLYLSLEIIVAYVLAFHIFQEKTLQKNISQSLLVGLLIAGLISDVRFFQAGNWWTQSDGQFIRETGQLIKESERPLLVINDSPINLGGILTLSRYSPKVSLLPVADDSLLLIPPKFSHILFMQNNSSLFHQLEQDKTYSLKIVKVLNLPPGGLWQFEKIEQS
ncbi:MULTISPECIES: glycosyltransferase family 39 protein [Nostoc]|uniref:Glycosyltransferase family 39 protein n=2 Tax=Nostoc TaxID=1177 RepID=A0ABR8I0Q3_9NOSO|nr:MULTISPECIES: glycosyltransferase family 39 protein [Nostoc]MBD2561907.1 glycosyltransferase family 39 protein [Nostoc linckia FACHB-391]MBD2644915.1 glycosyltransferase family 39 protein [Nostoc foliaceum FACHB-393]